VVITQAGNDPKVAGLVYIAAFAPDKGESVATLIANPATRCAGASDSPPQTGSCCSTERSLPHRSRPMFPLTLADFMASSQVPWGVQALEGKVSEAAWKSKPSWYLVATDDRMIPPPAQQFMSKRAGSTVVESKGSHSVYVSQPGAVATLIETATQALQASGAAVKVGVEVTRILLPCRVTALHRQSSLPMVPGPTRRTGVRS
jgi:pimeloyl-ACP methyl ester carboxylesterase